MIVLGVIRIRAAQRRSQQEDLADAEMVLLIFILAEELLQLNIDHHYIPSIIHLNIFMLKAWDDSALNITVNPMEVCMNVSFN